MPPNGSETSWMMPQPSASSAMTRKMIRRIPRIRSQIGAPGGGATRPMKRSASSWRLVGGVWPSFSAATLRSPARRSASASEASAMRRSCSRSCGRAAAIAARKCSRERFASIRSAARAPRIAWAAARNLVSASSSSSERPSSFCIAESADLLSIRIWRCLGGM